MELSVITGLVASVFTSAALIPQLVKIIKEKNGEGTSYGMLIVLFTGLSLWVLYGVQKQDIVIVGANSFSLLVNVSVGFFTFRYRNRR
jgi:MtN3 and saliva related transmembrane protein